MTGRVDFNAGPSGIYVTQLTTTETPYVMGYGYKEALRGGRRPTGDKEPLV